MKVFNMRNLLIYFSLFLSHNAICQLYVNGADFITNPLSVVYINNDSLIIDNNAQFYQNGFLRVDKDLINDNGTLVNDGDIYIYQDVIINDLVQGLTNTSNFYLNRNWINNDVFIPGQSTVSLIGTLQDLSGVSNTTFYNLNAQGVLSDIKRLVAVDAVVLNQLDLSDVEFETGNNTLSINNTSLNAIQRNTGFVSSLGLGRLERITNTNAPYLFPTGSSLGVLRYRPIEITPSTNLTDTFAVRLANTEATNEGFDLLSLNDSLCAVNPNFYHRVYGNNAAAIDMFYLAQEDGDWNAMAQWQGSNEWGKLPNELTSNTGQFAVLSIPSWSDFTNPAFALAIKRPIVDLADELTINLGQTINLQPNYLGPNPQNSMWFPLDQISCPNCLETEVNPFETTQYNLEIVVNEFCTLEDSVLVIVKPGYLNLPTAFSPNIDGVNDGFRPLNNNLEFYSISIYNRWGELIYTADDFTLAWDGTYKGKNAEIGVYTYTTEYSFKNQAKVETQSGSVTIIR